MTISWTENPSQLGLLLCISITLVIGLLFYINRQDYNTACDRRVMDLHYRAHISEGDYPKLSLSKYQGINEKKCCNQKTKHKRKLDPEKDIMGEHSMGCYSKVNKMDDPLVLDQFTQKQTETTDELLHRNLTTADYDGPQLEGMLAPITDFEDSALSRQMIKTQEVYGEQGFEESESDQISILNL